jgi:hypothetical protein
MNGLMSISQQWDGYCRSGLLVEDEFDTIFFVPCILSHPSAVLEDPLKIPTS